MAKYLKRYAEELYNGMRKDGKSIVECCLIWGITDKEYMQMLEAHVELQRAHQVGEMQCAAWWHFNYRQLAEHGNASALSFGMKNIDKVGWQDRPEASKQEETPIKAIKITILPARNDL